MATAPVLDVRKSALAERDLIDIWRYGFERWGETAADAYLDRIDEALGLLRQQPDAGADVSDLLAGHRRWRAGSHHIYYVVKGRALHVTRVLGVRQNPPLHLGD